jgi:glycosyltransferase involved in cell wall biosynthesis
MRILLVVHSLRRGGAERIVLDLARSLQNRGHLVEIAALLAVNEFPDESEALNVEFFAPADTYRWPASVPQFARNLCDAAQRFKPDVVQIHSPTAAVVAAWAGLRCAMYVLHGYGAITRPFSVKSWLARQLDSWASRRLGRNVVTVAPGMRKVAARYLGLPISVVRCIPNGIELKRFPLSRRPKTPVPLILMVGTLAWVKHPELGVDAMKALLGIMPSAQLQLAGDGPMRSELESCISSAGLSGNVVLLGRRVDVPELMAKADLLWHLSESEGLPLVVAEAMATGLPVVAHDVRGLRDIVRNGITGFLVTFGDQQALIAQTIHLLNDRALYDSFAQRGREHVENYFTADRMVLEHEAALADLLEQN